MVATMSYVVPTDADLVAQTRQGTAGALGMLLERHRAGLTSVAVRILGPGPDVEDVVHETFLVALSRIDRLREPESVGPWLMGIARNVCLQRLRAAREVPYGTLDPTSGLSLTDTTGPEEVIDRIALREWVWSALDSLSEPLRLAVILRHFSRANSYRDIASISGVPVGTVRSRLNQARAKLAEALLAEAAAADSDHGVLERTRRRRFEEAYAEYNRGIGLDLLAQSLEKDVETVWQDGFVLRGREVLAQNLSHDIAAGVKLHIDNVIASHSITVLDARFENPPDDPHHCPPLTTQVYLHNGDGIRSIRLHYGSN